MNMSLSRRGYIIDICSLSEVGDGAMRDFQEDVHVNFGIDH
jgi:hypothetical protein